MIGVQFDERTIDRGRVVVTQLLEIELAKIAVNFVVVATAAVC